MGGARGWEGQRRGSHVAGAAENCNRFSTWPRSCFSMQISYRLPARITRAHHLALKYVTPYTTTPTFSGGTLTQKRSKRYSLARYDRFKFCFRDRPKGRGSSHAPHKFQPCVRRGSPETKESEGSKRTTQPRLFGAPPEFAPSAASSKNTATPLSQRTEQQPLPSERPGVGKRDGTPGLGDGH